MSMTWPHAILSAEGGVVQMPSATRVTADFFPCFSWNVVSHWWHLWVIWDFKNRQERILILRVKKKPNRLNANLSIGNKQHIKRIKQHLRLKGTLSLGQGQDPLKKVTWHFSFGLFRMYKALLGFCGREETSTKQSGGTPAWSGFSQSLHGTPFPIIPSLGWANSPSSGSIPLGPECLGSNLSSICYIYV